MCVHCVSVFVYIFFEIIFEYLLLFISRAYCVIWYNSMFEIIISLLCMCTYIGFFNEPFFISQNGFWMRSIHSHFSWWLIHFRSNILTDYCQFLLFECYFYVTERATFVLNTGEHHQTSIDHQNSIFHFLLHFLPLPSSRSICWKNCVLICLLLLS